MAEVTILDTPTPAQVLAQLDTLLDPTDPPLTLMANFASLLYWSLDAINWVGFYLVDDAVLRLGPFHGKPACTAIALGVGVCGTAAAERRVLNVPDVHSFPGHIACDAASRSELVFPLIVGDTRAGAQRGQEAQAADGAWRTGELIGVLDVDSPVANRFDPETQELLACAVSLLRSRVEGRALFPA